MKKAQPVEKKSNIVAKKTVAIKPTTSNRTAVSYAVEIIKKHEGYRAKAYDDGDWYSIGWGSVATSAHEVIDKKEAEKRLSNTVTSLYKRTKKALPGLKEHQYAAIISLGYNCGSWYNAVLKHGPTKWRMTSCVTAEGKVLPGLVKRRANEWILFTSATIY